MTCGSCVHYEKNRISVQMGKCLARDIAVGASYPQCDRYVFYSGLDADTEEKEKPVVSNREMPHYVVFRSDGHPPRVEHGNVNDAVAESRRLATENPGVVFTVYKSIERVSIGMSVTQYGRLKNEDDQST